jgi:hypothetical protein
VGFLASCQEGGGYFVVFCFSDCTCSLLLLIMYIIAGTYEGIGRLFTLSSTGYSGFWAGTEYINHPPPPPEGRGNLDQM